MAINTWKMRSFIGSVEARVELNSIHDRSIQKRNVQMPIDSSIANAAYTFNENDKYLKKNVEGLTDEEWVRSPRRLQESSPVDRGPCDLGARRFAQAAG